MSEQNKNGFNLGDWKFVVSIVAILVTIIGIWVGVDKNSFVVVSSNKWTYIILSPIFIGYYIYTLKRQIINQNEKIVNQNEKIVNQNKEIVNQNKEIVNQNKEIVNQNKEIVKLRKDLEETISKKEPRFKRWEDFLDKKHSIKFGSLEYHPMLKFEAGEPVGIGIDILKAIFGNKLKPVDGKLTWDSMEKKLYDEDVNERIDIIATPILETNTRALNMSFSSPLFYSEIGLFVNAKGDIFTKRDEKNLTFEKAVNRIKSSTSLKAKSIKGEISHKLVKKHFPNIEPLKKNKSNYSIEQLMYSVINEEDNTSDLVFMEVYQAEMFKKQKIIEGKKEYENLINVLKPKKLLYPVVFALRKEDYILKNYINLKLLEIEGPSSGISSLIKTSLNKIDNTFKSIPDNKKDDIVNDYFIRKH